MSPQKERTSDRVEHLNPVDERLSFFDLSAGGVCCLSKTMYPDGALVKVRVGDLTLEARVAHSSERTDGYRVGLQFVNISPAQQSQLAAAVDGYSRGVPLVCGIVEHKGA